GSAPRSGICHGPSASWHRPVIRSSRLSAGGRARRPPPKLRCHPGHRDLAEPLGVRHPQGRLHHLLPRSAACANVSIFLLSLDTRQSIATLTAMGLVEAHKGSGRYRIRAIERAVGILNAFSTEQPELGVTEIAAQLGLHKSTVHRFLVSLEAGGLVERNPRTSRYRLGLRIFELGGLVLQQMNLWDEALPFLEGLVHESGETGHLAVLDGGEAIYIEKVEARRALRIPSAIGRGYPAHATSLGKVLLAHAP